MSSQGIGKTMPEHAPAAPGSQGPHDGISPQAAGIAASAAPRLPALRGLLLAGYAMLALLVFGFGLWAGLTKIDGAIVANGTVEVESNRQVVQHPDGGVVERIFVHDGDHVAAGAPLILLASGDMQSTLRRVENRLHDIQAQRARLLTEVEPIDEIPFPPDLLNAAATRTEIARLVERQRNIRDARRDIRDRMAEQLAQRIAQLEQQDLGLAAQLDALSVQRSLIARELRDQMQLREQGLARSAQVMALERESVGLDGQMGALTANRAQIAQQITEMQIESLRLASQDREEAEDQLRSLDEEELDLTEQRAALKARISRLVLRAPASGIVHELAVQTPQSVLRPADPVLFLIPQDRPFVIGARIAPNNVDEVSAGQQARLRISAFTGRDAPELTGQVTRLSPDALTDPRTGQSYYRAEIMPDQASLDLLQDRPLIPGMPAQVYLQTHERTPLSYLAAPLMGYLRMALRES